MQTLVPGLALLPFCFIVLPRAQEQTWELLPPILSELLIALILKTNRPMSSSSFSQTLGKQIVRAHIIKVPEKPSPTLTLWLAAI